MDCVACADQPLHSDLTACLRPIMQCIAASETAPRECCWFWMQTTACLPRAGRWGVAEFRDRPPPAPPPCTPPVCLRACPPAPQEYQFAIQAPNGALLSIPHHEAFSRDPQISFPAPWPPTAPNASQRYGFVLFVRDAWGLQTRPSESTRPVTIRAPACPRPCDVARPLLEYAGCLTCAGLGPVAALNEVWPGPHQTLDSTRRSCRAPLPSRAP